MSTETKPAVRPALCSDCPVTPGTSANKYTPTRVKAEVCARLGIPFYCHRNAEDTDYAEAPAQLCAGWHGAITATPPQELPEDERARLFGVLECVGKMGGEG